MNDGGYMFPRPLPNVPVPPDEALDLIRRYSGCTLRQWYAGRALPALIPLIYGAYEHQDRPGKQYSVPDLVQDALAIADHMLAEGEKDKKPEPVKDPPKYDTVPGLRGYHGYDANEGP